MLDLRSVRWGSAQPSTVLGWVQEAGSLSLETSEWAESWRTQLAPYSAADLSPAWPGALLIPIPNPGIQLPLPGGRPPPPVLAPMTTCVTGGDINAQRTAGLTAPRPQPSPPAPSPLLVSPIPTACLVLCTLSPVSWGEPGALAQKEATSEDCAGRLFPGHVGLWPAHGQRADCSQPCRFCIQRRQVALCNWL